jgi:hypothetical protein
MVFGNNFESPDGVIKDLLWWLKFGVFFAFLVERSGGVWREWWKKKSVYSVFFHIFATPKESIVDIFCCK